jgi:hypothetical protein
MIDMALRLLDPLALIVLKQDIPLDLRQILLTVKASY